MAGKANIPAWVLTQMAKEMQGPAANEKTTNPFLQHIAPGGAEGGPSDIRGAMVSAFKHASPGVPQLPEHPLGDGIGLMPKFLHLGGGLFLHPETGEIHGMGAPVAPSTPAPVRPGMAVM
jgi:hypothetical protein